MSRKKIKKIIPIYASLFFILMLLVYSLNSCKNQSEDHTLLLAGLLPLSGSGSGSGGGSNSVAGNGDKFVTVWDTTKTTNVQTVSNQIKLPLDSSGTYDFTVDWGDGSTSVITAYDQTEATHTYAAGGVYTLTINGTLQGFGFANNTGDRGKLLKVLLWGQSEFHNKGYQLTQCVNLTVFPNTETPHLQNITNLSRMFQSAFSFNQPLDNWDVSSVTNMNGTFASASTFNQPLNNWNVSSVTDMNGTFASASNFNQPLDNWDVSSVTDMRSMFHSASNFNQPLDNWDVSSVTDISWMFQSASNFNQPLNNWDVSSATNMYMVFYFASSFNQPLNNWNVSSVTLMAQMFQSASNFNQPLDNWDVSSVTNMDMMFQSAGSFAQNLSGWCVSSIGTAPSNFATGAGSVTPPVWGTCPAP